MNFYNILLSLNFWIYTKYFFISEKPVDACNPSPCGQNSICRTTSNGAVCSCQQGMTGSPPYCMPECIISADCITQLACVNNKCRDPCPGTCGQNAKCQVINHNPICSCASGFTGDPYTRCNEYRDEIPKIPTNACVPTPCGPNSDCKVINENAACSCLPSFIGTPPGCRPECTINTECSSNKACMNNKCSDPCPGSCGNNARCSVINHTPSCSCDSGFTGDPFRGCFLAPG